MRTEQSPRQREAYTAPTIDGSADGYLSWSVDDGGDIADYRIVPHITIWPHRIAGRWYWPGTPCYARQVMYRYENPPTFWVSVAYAFNPATLAR